MRKGKAIYNLKKEYFPFLKLQLLMSSIQTGGIHKYSSLPHTTKRSLTTNLKTKYNQNCQKIKLHGSPTTKELNKKHSSRLVRWAEIGSQGGENVQQGPQSWWTQQSHICAWISQEEQLMSETNHESQGSNTGK